MVPSALVLAPSPSRYCRHLFYKPPLTHEEAVKIIIKDKGTHFDPDVVDAFLTVSEEFRNIAREPADSEEQHLLKPDDRIV